MSYIPRRVGLPAAVDLGQLRADVALANRIVHRAGLVTAFGHVSARIPGTDSFLIPRRTSPALARAEELLLMDVDGRVLEGDGIPNSEVWIHARVYAARPELAGVAHVHSPACVALGQTGHSFVRLHNSGAPLGLVPLFNRVGLIRTRELGDEVARVLDQHRAMLLRGHGANVVAPDVRQAVVLACFLEEAASIQLRALAAVGGEVARLSQFTPEETARAGEEIGAAGPMGRAWEYYSAMTDDAPDRKA